MSRPNVIITHGLGNHPPDWYKPLAKQILSRIDAKIIPFYYHDIFQENQEQNYENYELLGNQRIRKFIFQNVADGVTYKQPQIYAAVHKKLRYILNQCLGVTVVIAPSLGGKVIMDHIWDHNKVIGNNKGELIDLFITNGCNIPLFVSGLDKIVHVEHDFKWFNFYDRSDVLGYPLAPLGYNAEDIRIKTHWGLLSHLKYWNNRQFLDRICLEINKIA